jgi:hypothetical protein
MIFCRINSYEYILMLDEKADVMLLEKTGHSQISKET